MKLLRRHKAVLLVLGIYWPIIFWLTHIPVPGVARQSGMSDKTMHGLAYFVLTFLVWFAVSPYQKARWNKVKVWVVLATVIGYAAIDEYLQGFVGRSVDMQDFIADVFGVVLGMGVLSIFGFWSAMLMFSAVFIFVISNLSNLPLLYPQFHLNVVFHFTAYTAFELIWIQYLERHGNPSRDRALWLMTSLAMPVLLLFGVKVTAAFFDRPFDWIDIAAGLFGMCAAILISGAVFKVFREKK